LACDKFYQVNKRPDGTQFLAILIGDAAMRVHFWPGRGLNSGIKAAVALSRRLYWAHTHPRNKTGVIRGNDLPLFVGFMHALVAREQASRSEKMLQEIPSMETVLGLATAKQKDETKPKKIFLAKLHQGRERQGYDEKLDAILKKRCGKKLKTSTIRILNISQPWPLAEMSGEEVNPNTYCKNPLEKNEQ